MFHTIILTFNSIGIHTYTLHVADAIDEVILYNVDEKSASLNCILLSQLNALFTYHILVFVTFLSFPSKTDIYLVSIRYYVSQIELSKIKMNYILFAFPF